MEVEVSFYGHLRRLAGTRRRTVVLPAQEATVGDLREAIRGQIPEVAPHLSHTSVGMGLEIFPDDAPLRPGVEVSLLPPVSGGENPAGDDLAAPSRIQTAPLSLQELLDETSEVDAGALVVFGGCVRAVDRGIGIAALDYDVHREMAERTLRRIEREISMREGVLSCRIVHRVGEVGAGEMSVYVVVRARHRPEAFEAAREGIERVKAEAEIWKEDVPAGDDPQQRG